MSRSKLQTSEKKYPKPKFISTGLPVYQRVMSSLDLFLKQIDQTIQLFQRTKSKKLLNSNPRT